MKTDFQVGDWTVRPSRNCIERGGLVVHVAPKAMVVLLCLVRAAGEVVSRQALFDAVWPECEVTDDALTQRIVELRRAFGDHASSPAVIETIPKRGFRLIPPVTSLPRTDEASSATGISPAARWGIPPWTAGALLAALAVTAWWWTGEEADERTATAGRAADAEDVATASADTNSIAVLPFDDLGPGEDDLRLADAIHEELLTRLARIASLRVISRTSVERYRDTDLTLPEIARALSVAAVLTGSVQQAGNRLRVHAQLVDGTTDEHLWADSYSRDLTAKNLFEIQAEIAESVSRALRASLTREETARVTDVPTDNFEAYRALLEGRVALGKLTALSVDEAIGHFERALEMNPDFPQAYLAMAGAYSVAAETSGMPEDMAMERIGTYARQAVSLDPGLGLAYHHLARIEREQGRLDEAEALYRRGYAVEPGNVQVLHGLGLTLRLAGRAEEAVPYYDRAAQIDPLSPLIQESRGSLLRDLGRFEDAEKQYRLTIELAPRSVNTYWGLGTLYWSMGRPGDAGDWFARAIRLAPESDVFRAWLALMHLEQGRDADARAVIDEALLAIPDHGYNDVVLADELYRLYHGNAPRAAADGGRFMFRYWYGGLLDLPPHALLQDRYEAAIARYEERYPGISGGDATIDSSSFRAAIYVAYALDALGDRQAALKLLDRAEAVCGGMQRLGIHGYWVADAQILAIRGDLAGSIERLDTAIDEGWRNLWRYYLLYDPILARLAADPRYRTIVDRVRAEHPGAGP